MSLYVEFALEFTNAQDFYEGLVVDESCFNELINANLLKVLLLSEGLKYGKIDSLVLHTVDILEAVLGKTTLERHLTTFETNLLAVARASLSTLVTTSRSTAHTRAGTATDTLAGLYRAEGRLESMQFHIVNLRM